MAYQAIVPRVSRVELAAAADRLPAWLRGGVWRLVGVCAAIWALGMLSPRLDRHDAGVVVLVGAAGAVAVAVALATSTHRLLRRLDLRFVSASVAQAEAVLVLLRRVGLLGRESDAGDQFCLAARYAADPTTGASSALLAANFLGRAGRDQVVRQLAPSWCEAFRGCAELWLLQARHADVSALERAFTLAPEGARSQSTADDWRRGCSGRSSGRRRRCSC